MLQQNNNHKEQQLALHQTDINKRLTRLTQTIPPTHHKPGRQWCSHPLLLFWGPAIQPGVGREQSGRTPAMAYANEREPGPGAGTPTPSRYKRAAWSRRVLRSQQGDNRLLTRQQMARMRGTYSLGAQGISPTHNKD